MKLGWPTDVFWCDAPLHEVVSRVDRHPVLAGELSDRRVDLSVRGRNKNSWRPRILGRAAPAGGGTFVEIRYELHGLVFFFTLLHGIPFLGFTWVVGFLAFQMGVTEARNALLDALAPAARGEDAWAKANYNVSDPTLPGAAAGAPISLRAQHGMDDVRFAVKGGWLRVDSGGLSLTGAQTERITWDSLEGAIASGSAYGSFVALKSRTGRVVEVPLGDIPDADQRWLADYLNARDAQRSATAEDREQAAALHRAVRARSTP